VNNFVESFRYIQSSLSEKASFQNEMQILQSHGIIRDISPENEIVLNLLKSTYPLKVSGVDETETSNTTNNNDFTDNEVLGTLTTSVFGMFHKFKQCLSHVLRNPVISFMDFRVGDIALFMPQYADNRKIWIAFNSNSPYHFLEDQSLELFLGRSKDKENRIYILGRIVLIDHHTASVESNPYPLPVGTPYHVVHCEPLKSKSIKANTTWANVVKAGSSEVTAGTGTSSIDEKAGISSDMKVEG